ncbi:hypothetical protein [Streptomyces sp. NPDC048638]|uniref:hypothetical protein n=1 Tax=Streptomyces sp. NPDC048638 TaxID=3365580 RepID=UPI00371B4EB0
MPDSPQVANINRIWWRCVHLFAIVGILVVSGAFAWMGLTQAGLVGTHGTFTVEWCYENHHVNPKQHSTPDPVEYTCRGTFRSDDGKVVAGDAQVSELATDHPKGRTLSTQRSGSQIMLDDRQGAMSRFLIAFGFLLADAFVLFWFLTRLDKNGKSLKETWRTTKGTPTRAVVVGIAAVAVAGLAVSPLLALVLPG